MAWMTNLWRWLVRNWNFDRCEFCGEQTCPKDESFIPCCDDCNQRVSQ